LIQSCKRNTWLKASIASAICFGGVLQPRVFSGRLFSSRSHLRLSHVLTGGHSVSALRHELAQQPLYSMLPVFAMASAGRKNQMSIFSRVQFWVAKPFSEPTVK